jgi:hypothetical protein
MADAGRSRHPPGPRNLENSPPGFRWGKKPPRIPADLNVVRSHETGLKVAESGRGDSRKAGCLADRQFIFGGHPP